MSDDDVPAFKTMTPKGELSPYEYYVRNEQLVREAQIAGQTAQLLREKLAHCVRTEGLNSNVACYDLRKQYFELLSDRYRGMIFPEGSEPVNRKMPNFVYIAPTDDSA